MSSESDIAKGITPVGGYDPGYGYYLEFDHSVGLFKLNQIRDDSALTVELNANEAKMLCEQLYKFIQSENI